MHRRLAVVLAVTASALSAQGLVANLVTTTQGQVSSAITRFVPLGNQALFAATNSFGTELWVTDGTPTGTHMVADLYAGGSSNPAELVAQGGVVLFAATVPGLGRELWRSDGTLAGTTLVKDVRVGDGDANPTSLTSFAGFVWFAATDGTNGIELWRSDGTANGTTLFADIRVGNSGSSPARLVVAGGWLWLTASDGITGTELWRTDGVSTTQRIADLTAGIAPTTFGTIAPFGNRVLFSADAGAGLEPFVSDGTAGGTFALGDLAPGATGSSPASFTAIGGIAVFTADGAGLGRELWVTDGTTAGTALLADLQPGAVGSDPASLTAYGGAVVFAATTASGREPWRTDGTVVGTFQLADLMTGTGSSNPAGFAPVNGELWFTANGLGVGGELHHSDGTPAGTGLLLDLQPGTGNTLPTAITAFGGGALFSGLNGGAASEPHFTDGTAVGTVLLDDIAHPATSSNPAQWADLGNGVVFFAAGSNALGNEPYRTDGTPAGTAMITDLQPGSFGSGAAYAASIGDRVFFRGDLSGVGEQLFVTDGTAIGTTRLTLATPAVAPRGMTTFGSRVVFSGFSANGREPWISDGTVAGTHEIADVRVGSADSIPFLGENFTVVGNQVFFTAFDPAFGSELWVTDGTATGTHLVADLVPGSFGSSPTQLTAVGNWLYFVASSSFTGTEVWRSDGNGIVLVADLVPGIISSFPQSLTAAAGKAFFTASVGGQREVWATTGTPLSTAPVTTTAFGRLNPFSDLRGTDVGLFFLHDDLAGFGTELWCSDGALGGTRRVLDVAPGQRSGPVPGTLLAAFGGTQLVFGAGDHDNGLQLWRSDGTTNGTQRVSNFGQSGSGVGAAAFTQLFANGARVFFSCDDGVNGFEPWMYDPVGGVVPFVLPYGHGCIGSNGVPQLAALGAPTLGNAAFTFTLLSAMPNTIAVFVGSLGSTNLDFGSCDLFVDLPIVILGGPLTDPVGAAVQPFPIPNDLSWLGDNLFFQFAVLDPLGSVLGLFVTSNALQVQVGS